MWQGRAWSCLRDPCREDQSSFLKLSDEHPPLLPHKTGGWSTSPGNGESLKVSNLPRRVGFIPPHRYPSYCVKKTVLGARQASLCKRILTNLVDRPPSTFALLTTAVFISVGDRHTRDGQQHLGKHQKLFFWDTSNLQVFPRGKRGQIV